MTSADQGGKIQLPVHATSHISCQEACSQTERHRQLKSNFITIISQALEAQLRTAGILNQQAGEGKAGSPARPSLDSRGFTDLFEGLPPVKDLIPTLRNRLEALNGPHLPRI